MRRSRKGRTTYISVILILVIFAIRYMLPMNEKDVDSGRVKGTLDLEVDTSSFDKVYVEHVIDGDTVLVKIGDGYEKVRFIGINTPEKDENLYQDALEYTKAAIEGKYIFLEKDISETDQFGRLLRYIWLELPKANDKKEKDLKLFNGHLVLAGFAEVVLYLPDDKYNTYLRTLNKD